MNFLSPLLVLAAAFGYVSSNQAQGNSTDDSQKVPVSMSLTQFQKVLRTFVDDEIAIVVDDLNVDDEMNDYSPGDNDNSSFELKNITETESLDIIMRNRISFIETDANGRHRRILKNHHHRHKHGKSGKDAPAPHQRGRFADVDPSSIPIEVNATWDGIISHAWKMAKLSSKSEKGTTKVSGRNKEKRSRASGAESKDMNEYAGNEDSDELITDWSDETETLFLVCHSSQHELDGNAHLKEILTAAGKDFNVLGSPESIEVVHSTPLLTCVILSIEPTLAWNIAERTAASTSDVNIYIAPWVDIMKISPEILDQVLSIDENDTYNSAAAGQQRGLRNFRRTQANSTEEMNADSLMWLADPTASAMQNNYIVFSLIPPSTVEDAYTVIESMMEMAKVGQRRRRRMTSDAHRREISITDAFSITGFNAGKKHLSPSAHHWSRLLESGLESNNECIALFEAISLQPSLMKSSYEFLLNPTDGNMNSTTHAACIASAIAGLSVNPLVVNVGIVPKQLELHNAKAQWVLQGSAVKANDGTSWRRPFFDSGLRGQGQIVSVSDTGLDVDNCYFKDARGNGDIFNTWDRSRRKVVRYDVSPRGGDIQDAYQGHGTHVVGTLGGKHVRGRMGDGDDSKEGIAPAAKVHFFDIGLGNAVNDPREHWLESFYKNGRNNGAKIASGSWGFGYRASYDWVCRLYDQIVYEHPDVIHVSSAGNTGNEFNSPYHTIGAPSSCKNPFAVGATNNAGYGSGTSYVVDFSSRGPTSDGRTKPDIMAPGYALDSASSGFNKCAQDEPTYLKAGTSMATPAVAGAAAIVRQYFLHGYYPCGSKRCSKSVAPSGALVKAVLANGAQPLDGVQVGGTATVLSSQNTLPYDNTQGFGISNLLTSLPLKNENDFSIFVQNDVAVKSDHKLTFDFDINGSSCSSDFSATIAWYDPAASNGCTKCLVNDLDLLVENISSSTKYYPNGLSKPDTVNNLERVRVSNTISGHKYRVTVQASMIGPGYSSQNVALVVTGCFGGENGTSKEQEQTPTPKPSTTTLSRNLETTYKANRKQAGNMFSIQAKTEGVKITSFAIHTLLSKTTKLHVYTLNTLGSYEAFTTDPTAWTRISPSSGIEIEAKGFGTPTLIPIGSFESVSIPKDATQSFYITFIDETEMLYQAVNNDYPTGSVFSSDDAIKIFSGVGRGLDFGATWRHRQMNGAVYYSVTT